MMDSKPFFSILIPTRDRHALAARAIGSVLSQNFKDFELRVIDNSTDDKTKLAVEEFSNKDNRVFYVKSGGLSMPDNWDLAYKNANGTNLIILTDRMYFSTDNVLAELAAIHKKFPHAILTYHWIIESKKAGSNVNLDYSELVPSDILDKFFAGGKNRNIFNYESPKGLNTSLPEKIYSQTVEKYGRLCFPLSPDFGMSFVLLHENFPIIHIQNPLIVAGGMDVSNGNKNRKNKFGVNKYLVDNDYPEQILFEHTPVPVSGVYNSMYNDFFALSDKFNWGYSWENVNMVEYFLLLRDEIVNNEYETDKKSDLEKWNDALRKQPKNVIADVENRISAKNDRIQDHSVFHRIKSKIKKLFS